MHKSHAKRRRDIKNKLMAAICMLLVSSIMMVSTTYAWFTLSTAPEVTGINTAVGANGNLEMALMPKNGLDQSAAANFGIGSSVGDSVAPVNERNITWGNLVDVSNNTYYGLDLITLYPSELLTADQGKDAAGNPTVLSGGALLATPSYGADGRIAELLKNTSTGIYDSTEKGFFPDSDTSVNYGVRAIGTASGQTPRQLSYRQARIAANDARGLAQTYAAQSLNANGNALASIAVKKAADGDAAQYSAEDLASMGAIINDLEREGGILDQIEKAYMQYILALAASAASGETDVPWSTVKSLVDAENATLASVVAGLPGDIELPEAVTNGIDAYNDSVSDVATAKTAYNDLLSTEAPYTWTQVSGILTKLANPDMMLINGIESSQVMAKKQQIVDDVLAGKGITVTVTSGGGVYADVADQSGNYKANVKIENVEFGGMTLNTNAIMDTKSNVTPAYLAVMQTAVEAAGAPTSAGDTAMPMSDMYGYIIDLAFRTNAADSNLLLQVDGVDRIYEGSSGAEITVGEGENKITESTMGHGATMTFASTSATFGTDQVKALMKSIRIVFFNPVDRSVLATAKLDVDTAEVGSDGVTAKMYLYKLTEAGSVSYQTATYAADSNKTYYTKDAATYTPIDDTTAATATEQLYELVDGSYQTVTYAADSGKTYYTKNADSYTEIEDSAAATYEGQLYVQVTNSGEERITDMKITSLNQNTATAVSVLVYLDGNSVTNADVSATGSSSMKGTMNLQFASSANLTPMEYTPLMDQGAAQNTENGGAEGGEEQNP